MAKNFAPRVSKKDRSIIDMSDRLERDLLKIADNKLLKGAKLDEIELASICVKEQVRTKFNDSSIRELAKNIEINGLIQPLVLHCDRNGKLTLICGERRFRAMSLIDMKFAPCFILENKSEQELMAIQFSENSSREELHYIDKADGILNYHIATNASERKIQAALGISKSEVHRSLLIARMASSLKEAAKKFNIEKYVLVEFDALEECAAKRAIEEKILSGEITKRVALRREIRLAGLNVNKPAMVNDLSKLAVDEETKKLIQSLLIKQNQGIRPEVIQ